MDKFVPKRRRCDCEDDAVADHEVVQLLGIGDSVQNMQHDRELETRVEANSVTEQQPGIDRTVIMFDISKLKICSLAFKMHKNRWRQKLRPRPH
jgi:hypothetical protein